MQSKKVKYYLPIDGLFYVLLPLPFLWAFFDGYFLNIHSIFALISSLFLFSSALFLNRNIIIAKGLAIYSIFFCFFVVLPLIHSPFETLLSLVIFITTFFPLLYLDSIIQDGYESKQSNYYNAQLKFTFIGLLLVLAFNLIFYDYEIPYFITLISSCIAVCVHIQWSIRNKHILHTILAVCTLICYGIAVYINYLEFIPFISLSYCFYIFIYCGQNNIFSARDNPFQFLFEKPEYCLVIFFVSMCTLGSLLLALPFSTNSDSIAIIDLIFTSVSAVCVTGLVVLDIGRDFTAFGQVVILFLIQMGGLGIMTITVFIAYLLRKKFSMAQERVLTEIISTSNKTLIDALIIVLKVTFVVEILGAIILTICYFNFGDSLADSLWKGVFTSISAFCNAGFTLNTDSLIMYQTSPFLMYTVTLLVIIGGIEPATCLFIPSWVRGKPIPFGVRLPLVMTAYLLVFGTLFILIFEYNGFLGHLSFMDKLSNAWFQNVTLRTAGFNTVDLSHVSGATFLMMLIFMFIGGSPAGTAGGMKTATLFIIIVTFWATIKNKSEITLYKRELCKDVSLKAIAIVFAGILIWISGVLILDLTQQDISTKKIMFEVTSAMGTVGLSMGITAMLDEIGKTTLILLMLLGRVGFITIFVLISRDQNKIQRKYPEVKYTLT